MVNYSSQSGQESSDTIQGQTLSYEKSPDDGNKTAPQGFFRNKRNLVIIASIAAFIVIAAGVSYALVSNPSPRALYFTAELGSFRQANASIESIFGDYWSLQNHMRENPYRSTTTISPEISGINFPELADLDENLQNSTIQVVNSMDPNNNRAMVSFHLSTKEDCVFSVEAYQSEDQTGFSLPYLNDKYFFINNDDYGNLIRKFDPTYNGPERIENFTHYMAKSQENELDLREYFQLISSTLEEENFSLEKDVVFRDNQYRKFTLTLPEEELKTLLGELITIMEHDDELLKIITDSAQAREEYKQGLNELKEELKSIAFPGGFVSELIIDKNNNIINRTVTFTVADSHTPEDGVRFTYESTNLEEKTRTKAEKQLSVKSIKGDDEELKFFWNTVDNPGFTETRAGMQVLSYGAVESDIQLLMDTSHHEQTKVTDFQLLIENNEPELDPPIIFGTVKQTVDQDLSNGYSNQDTEFSLTFGTDDFYQGYREVTLTMDMESRIEFTDDLNFPDFQSAESTNAIDLTEEEIAEYIEDVVNSLADFIQPVEE